MPALLRTSSFLTLSIHDTRTKLLKHFISGTFPFLLSALLIPHASAPYNAFGTITSSYRHFLAFIQNPLLPSAHFSALPTLYTHHSFCVPHLFHILHQLLLATPVISIITINHQIYQLQIYLIICFYIITLLYIDYIIYILYIIYLIICRLLLLLLKKVGSARLRESGIHPISLKTPAIQHQPIDRKKRNGKKVEDYSRDRAA